MSKTRDHAEDIDHELEHASREVAQTSSSRPSANRLARTIRQYSIPTTNDLFLHPTLPSNTRGGVLLMPANISGDLNAPLPARADTLSQSILDRVAATPDALLSVRPPVTVRGGSGPGRKPATG